MVKQEDLGLEEVVNRNVELFRSLNDKLWTAMDSNMTTISQMNEQWLKMVQTYLNQTKTMHQEFARMSGQMSQKDKGKQVIPTVVPEKKQAEPDVQPQAEVPAAKPKAPPKAATPKAAAPKADAAKTPAPKAAASKTAASKQAAPPKPKKKPTA